MKNEISLPSQNTVGTFPVGTLPTKFPTNYTAKTPRTQWGHSPQNTTWEQNENSVRKILKDRKII